MVGLLVWSVKGLFLFSWKWWTLLLSPHLLASLLADGFNLLVLYPVTESVLGPVPNDPRTGSGTAAVQHPRSHKPSGTH